MLKLNFRTIHHAVISPSLASSQRALGVAPEKRVRRLSSHTQSDSRRATIRASLVQTSNSFPSSFVRRRLTLTGNLPNGRMHLFATESHFHCKTDYFTRSLLTNTDWGLKCTGSDSGDNQRSTSLAWLNLKSSDSGDNPVCTALAWLNLKGPFLFLFPILQEQKNIRGNFEFPALSRDSCNHLSLTL